jgi:hypothetical protein
MSDIYLQITETPTVVTLSAPVISGALSSTVTVANTVTVALDANSLSALENVTVTVGAAVTISNFPATQMIAGTVTANNSVLSDVLEYDGSNFFLSVGGRSGGGNTNFPINISGTVTIGAGTVTIGSALPAGTNQIGVVTASLSAGTAQIGSVTASISNSVTIGSLPAISGTVTANIGNSSAVSAGFVKICGEVAGGAPSDPKEIITDSQGMLYARIAPSNSLISDPVKYDPVLGDAYINVRQYTGTSVTISSLPPISGTVTANLDQTNFFDAINNYAANYSDALPIRPDGISLPISGTVTANTFAVQGTAVTTSNFTSTTASTVLANYNATREVLTIFNEGAGNLHICAGATCTTIAYQVRLSAGDYYEVPNHQTTITHSAVFATAGTARVTEVS